MAKSISAWTFSFLAFRLGKFRTKFECDQVANFCASNVGESFRGVLTLDCKVIDSGDSRHVATIFAFKDLLDKILVDIAKKVLDRLVLHHRPFRSYGTLKKNTHALRILVKDGLDNRYLLQPTGNPEITDISRRIEFSHIRTHLLKPYLKAGVKNWDKETGFCPGLCEIAKK
jgi:hypothetical protein